MAPKEIFCIVLILAFCAKIGFAAFQCHQCSGSMKDCNNSTAEIQTCVAGQNRCGKLMLMKDGKNYLMYGCASENDCTAGTKACIEVEKNVRTKCMAECCNTTACNMPPNKDPRMQCHMCESGTSMADCIQNSWVGYCPNDEKRCGKFTTELMMGEKKLMVYRKGCRTEESCKEKKDLFGQACGSDDTCDIQCCDTDMCNAGSFPTVSVISLFACAFLAFLNM